MAPTHRATLEIEPAITRASVSGPPSSWDYLADRRFRMFAQVGVWLILLLLAFILWSIGGKAWVGMRDYGLGFLTWTTWDVGRQQFGILPQIWGTLYSLLLALAIGGFFGVAMAILLTQDFLPPRLAQVFRTIVELLELRDGGIRDVVEWHSAHRNDPPRDRAAGLYVRMLCHPQLFIEGNHRTGALIMSYVMLQDGEPPFVLVSDQRCGLLRRLHRPSEH